jgi:hypothetical protein
VIPLCVKYWEIIAHQAQEHLIQELEQLRSEIPVETIVGTAKPTGGLNITG